MRTQTELIEQRRKSRIPDPSYDLNGDGHISAREYFMAKHFDKNNDGKLDAEERKAAMHALKNVSFIFIYLSLNRDSKIILSGESINQALNASSESFKNVAFL